MRGSTAPGNGVGQSTRSVRETRHMVEHRAMCAQRIGEGRVLAVAVHDDASVLAVDLDAVRLGRSERHEQIRDAAVRELEQQHRGVVFGAS